MAATHKESFRVMNETDIAFIKMAKNLKIYPVITRSQISVVAKTAKVKTPYWVTNSPKNRVAPSTYFLPDEEGNIDLSEMLKHKSGDATAADLTFEVTQDDLHIIRKSDFVPLVDAGYVGWGRNYLKIEKFIIDGGFCPIFVTGLSGNGKTTMIEQICARNNREYVRCNITELTDEDDILGGLRLENGNTVFHFGPAVIAAERGAVLLLDEIDLGSQKMMCLQPILEGKPFFIKKINKWIYPAPGFTIIATANTKGLGDETGGFAGTNFLNEAMLDRFWYMYEQEYPCVETESRILSLVFEKEKITPNKEIIKALTAWAADNRKTYKDSRAIDKVITTRRLVTTVRHFIIFDDIMDAVRDGVTRFDEATRDALISLFEKYIPKPEIPDIGAGNANPDAGWEKLPSGGWYKDDATAKEIFIKNNVKQELIDNLSNTDF